MSGYDDAPQPAPADHASAGDAEIEIDAAAFLPDGVTFAAAAVAEEVEAEPSTSSSGVDLDALRQIELDLDAVDAAIAALDAGTYGIDPETGERIDDALLAADPTRLS